MSSPWLTSSGCCSFFSLYVGVRSSQLTGVTVASSQASSVCSGRWLWTKSVQRLRVEAEGEQRGGHLARPAAQRVGVVEARQRVVVDDAVDRLVLVLERDVVADRAQVVAEVDDPRRLDAGEDPAAPGMRHRPRGGAGPFGRHGSASVSASATAMPLLCRCDAAGQGRRAPAITVKARIPGNDNPCAGARRRAGFVASGAVARPGFGPIPPLRSPDERAGAARRRPRRGHGRAGGHPGADRAPGRARGRRRPALELSGIAVRDVEAAARRGTAGRAADRRAGPPRRATRRRRHRRADGRRRAGPHADRGGAVAGQGRS